MRTIYLAVCTLLFVTLAASAQPQADWSISAGVFPTSFSTSARLASEETSNSSDVDLENDLGLDSQLQNLRLEGFWRFKPNHRLEFGYTSWRRSADKTIEIPIDWQDTHYEAGATLHSVNNAQFLKFAYNYSFFHTETTEIAASIGIDAVWTQMSLEGQGTIEGGGGQVSGNFETEDSFIAPAPVLGVNASHMVTPKILLRGSLEYFQATIEDTTGKILDTRGSADYFFTPNWGAGVGYTWVGYKVERPRFDAKYDFSGPLLYVSYHR